MIAIITIRWKYVEEAILTKLKPSVFNHVKVVRCISMYIPQRYLAYVYRYVTKRKFTYCLIDLHVVRYMYMDKSTCRWKYVDLF